MKGKLKKLALEKGKTSSVKVGSEYVGPLRIVRNGNLDLCKKLSDIIVGDMLLIGKNIFSCLKTSPIQNIIKITKASITFQTSSSIYAFTKSRSKK